ncbi:MAG: polysaccharide biosynthesis/export family protein [Dysgonamonadaceae bacterium]|jgi:polysaccharide export outer membrane protein|nr:polysaccharide biosynthesis/export family protein [Dysgonamonadaceae bacterium]
MKIKAKIFFSFALLILVTSCGTSKKVPLFQIDDERSDEAWVSFYDKNPIRLKPGDVLGISVNVLGEPKVGANFNLPLIPQATTENSSENSIDQGLGRQTFLIDENGEIDFPELGRLKVAGYTQTELERHLKAMLVKELLQAENAPIITVRLLSFRLYFMGEVGSPGWKTVPSEMNHINILEALSLAGDITLHGKRDAVKVTRRLPDGSFVMKVLDVGRMDVVSSPDFYLQQGDMIYVEPIKIKTHEVDISPRVNLVISLTTFVIGITSFILAVSR